MLEITGALTIDHHLELTEGTHDFICVNAAISDVCISDQYNNVATVESMECCTQELIDHLESQTQCCIPKTVISDLLALNEEDRFHLIHDWVFGDCGPTNFDASSLRAIPDGPEPFLATIGFVVLDPKTSIGHASIKNKIHGLRCFKVDYFAYMQEWKNLHSVLKNIMA